jgi:hypothetical protein
MTAGCATGAYDKCARILQRDRQSTRRALPPTGHLVGTAAGPRPTLAAWDRHLVPRGRRPAVVEVELNEVDNSR